MEGRTTIAIAHRLSTILRADQILVYDRGRDRRARHASRARSRASGLYARLYREQFLAQDEQSVARARCLPARSDRYDGPVKLRTVTLVHQHGETFTSKTGTGRPYVFGDVLAKNEYSPSDRSWRRSPRAPAWT